MVQIDKTIEIELRCKMCGTDLSAETKWVYDDYMLVVDPCENCIEDALEAQAATPDIASAMSDAVNKGAKVEWGEKEDSNA